MARPLRVQFPGAVYHVTSRGNDRRDIYRDDRDRKRFLAALGKNVEEHHIRLYAFSLMSNHYHLVLETPRANLAELMQQLNTAYSVYFNLRHRRSGHLLGGRYGAKLVETDEYLLRLTRYVHLNPVKVRRIAGLPLEERRAHLRAYPWSSYRSYTGLAPRLAWMDYGPLQDLVGRGTRRKEQSYRQYVEEGLLEEDADLRAALSRSSKAIGLEPFCQRVEEQYRHLTESQGQQLDVAMRRIETPRSVETVLDAVCAELGAEIQDLRKRRSVGDARLLAMKLLKEEAGLTQREIAVQLGLRDGSTISRRLGDLGKRFAREPDLRRRYERVRKRLAA